jgi:hypothetical protein
MRPRRLTPPFFGSHPRRLKTKLSRPKAKLADDGVQPSKLAGDQKGRIGDFRQTKFEL